MVDLVIASLDLVNGIKDCELVIVCDKMRIIEPDKKMNWKSGKVNELSQSNYEKYIQNLIEKYGKENTSSVASCKSEHMKDTMKTKTNESLSNELYNLDKMKSPHIERKSGKT